MYLCIVCLIFIAGYVSKYLLSRDKMWNIPWMLLNCILYWYARPGCLIRTVGKCSMVLHIRTVTDIVCPRPTFLRRSLIFTLGKLYICLKKFLCFLHQWMILCLLRSICRFIRPFFILAPPDSNVAFYAEVRWLFRVLYTSLFGFVHISDFIAALASRGKN